MAALVASICYFRFALHSFFDCRGLTANQFDIDFLHGIPRLAVLACSAPFEKEDNEQDDASP